MLRSSKKAPASPSSSSAAVSSVAKPANPAKGDDKALFIAKPPSQVTFDGDISEDTLSSAPLPLHPRSLPSSPSREAASSEVRISRVVLAIYGYRIIHCDSEFYV
jgi:hypothetical protein